MIVTTFSYFLLILPPPLSRVVIFTAAYYVCDGVSLTVRKLRAHLKAKGIDSRVVSAAPDGWSEEDVFTVRKDFPHGSVRVQEKKGKLKHLPSSMCMYLCVLLCLYMESMGAFLFEKIK